MVINQFNVVVNIHQLLKCMLNELFIYMRGLNWTQD